MHTVHVQWQSQCVAFACARGGMRMVCVGACVGAVSISSKLRCAGSATPPGATKLRRARLLTIPELCATPPPPPLARDPLKTRFPDCTSVGVCFGRERFLSHPCPFRCFVHNVASGPCERFVAWPPVWSVLPFSLRLTGRITASFRRDDGTSTAVKSLHIVLGGLGLYPPPLPFQPVRRHLVPVGDSTSGRVLAVINERAARRQRIRITVTGLRLAYPYIAR